MDASQWLLFILIVQLVHFAGTWKLYQKAGRKAWEAAIPVYNAIVLMKIIRRPTWWVVLLFIPIINLLMFPVIWVETIRSFGKNSLLDTWLVILSLGFYIYFVNYSLDVQYVENRSLNPKSGTGEWVSSIVFAIVAATLVHTYFMQPYVIPTGSLEKTLLVGDFLFVSKFHYGARAPMTTIAAPMVHDTLPVLGVRSYLNNPQLPYFRLPGFQEIKRNEIVVFSWPADTVRIFFKKEEGVKKPIDKKSNYVKRCVGLPGDSLSVVGGYVYINGEKTTLPGRAKPQYTYAVYSDKGVSSRLLLDNGITEFNRKYLSAPLNQAQLTTLRKYLEGANPNTAGEIELYTNYRGIPPKVVRQAGLSLREVTDRERYATMTDKEAEALRQNTAIDSVVKQLQPKGQQGGNIFPQDSSYPWNNDYFGPIYIPEAGKTVPLNLRVLPLYKKIIRDYEGNTISVSGNQIHINGELADTYTFKQDYYWMMGDNRHRSEDSRTWGYVPENHIVGKPVFIWMSIEGITDGFNNWKPRWDRFFTTVHGDGVPRSYFRYFLLLLVGWFVWDFFRKRRGRLKK
jgi:signal peptidase I